MIKIEKNNIKNDFADSERINAIYTDLKWSTTQETR